ncbi:Disease resistance protein L6 [Linum grandiflorum]
MQLFRCNLYDLDDPFADFPSLKSLKLISCHSKGLEVSGLQLVDLEIRWVEEAIEVFAPKLKSFIFEGCNYYRPRTRMFPKLNLPNLDQARVILGWISLLRLTDGDIVTEEANRAFIDLLCGLRYAKSLVLFLGHNSTRDDFPFAAMKSLMNPKASPFTRLKTLKFLYRERQPIVPDQELRTFRNRRNWKLSFSYESSLGFGDERRLSPTVKSPIIVPLPLLTFKARRGELMAAAGSSKIGRRSKHVPMEEIDRLSGLPDNILYIILSLLDTTTVVQTSILGRRWKCLWKDVPVLDLWMPYWLKLDFKECVDKILSLRSRHINVEKVKFELEHQKDPDMQTFARVMEYAGSQGNGGHLHHLSIGFGHGRDVEFSSFAASIVANRIHQSLRTLELADCRLYAHTSAGFTLLTNLQLYRCSLSELRCSVNECDDPFADFPCLKSLKLISCKSQDLKVSGLQLVDLELRWMEEKIEVFAPKLKSFLLEGANHHHRRYPKLNLPILDQAKIRLVWYQFKYGDVLTEVAKRAFIDLMCGLHNAKSLVLYLDVHSDQADYFPLTAMKSLMDPQASPFTRLKTLTILYRKEPPLVPYQGIHYFFNGSPSSEDQTLLFEKAEEGSSRTVVKGRLWIRTDLQAITESKVYIPIISRNYASSKWCLQELAKMVDCWKSAEKGGRHSNPVFEQHDPRDVRHPESNPVFEQHDPKHDPEIVKSALNIDSLPSERHGFFNSSTGLARVRPSSLRSYRIQIRCPVICARKGKKGSGYQRLAKILPRLAFTMASNLKVLPEPLGLIVAELSSTGNGGEGGAGSWKGFSGGGGGWGRKRGKRRNLMVLLGLLLVCGVLVYMDLSGKAGTDKYLILGVSAILVQGIGRGARDCILGCNGILVPQICCLGKEEDQEDQIKDEDGLSSSSESDKGILCWSWIHIVDHLSDSRSDSPYSPFFIESND